MSANDHQSELLPRSPWATPAANNTTLLWRARCGAAIGCVGEAIGGEHSGKETEKDGAASRVVINLMLGVLFQENQEVSVMERSALIAWLGSASAISSRTGERTWKSRNSIGYIESEMLVLWTAAAWRSSPEVLPAAWARGVVETVCNIADHVGGVYRTWGDVIDDRGPGRMSESANAQMDMLTFLQAFDQQKGLIQQADPGRVDGGALVNDDESRKAALCFVALRILASATGRVDERVLSLSKEIENLYNHDCIDQNVLRLAGVADDYKALSAAIEVAPEGAVDLTHPRGRKL